jgi:hypothetical protein
MIKLKISGISNGFRIQPKAPPLMASMAISLASKGVIKIRGDLVGLVLGGGDKSTKTL